jgi:ferrous iron transport protein B
MNEITIGLVGNPNCGKTTLFNALTGARQKVGNWPGVTVERKSGFYKEGETSVEVVDLPGTYSLTMISESSSIDEKIACDYIQNGNADVIVNIVDASHLERSLYLTLQLLEMKVPMILAINMMDVARERGIHISLGELEKLFGCSVVSLEANRGKGIKELRKAIVNFVSPTMKSRVETCHPCRNISTVIADKNNIEENDSKQDALIKTPINKIASYKNNVEDNDWKQDTSIKASVDQIASYFKNTFLIQIIQKIAVELPLQIKVPASWLAIRLLEEDLAVRHYVSDDLLKKIPYYQKELQAKTGEDADILLADARYRFIEEILNQCVQQTKTSKTSMTARLDGILLNRWLGIPFFLMVMYLMFLFAINVGGAFQDFFDIGSSTIFVGGVEELLTQWHAPTWLIAILANGVGKGINTTLTFIPVIGAMFLFLAFLEDSGYMARATFVIDRLMRAMGLPGKSFIPMIVGFGCNVPAVMAARTLENKRDRILTIMMSPFMSCGARLAIYAVFVAAFFPHGGQNIIFALYLIGIAAAMLTGLLLRKTFLQGDPAPLLMELPVYHVPNIKTLCLHAWQRLKGFVFRAGKLIVPICVLLGVLNSLTLNGAMNSGDGDANSLLSWVGRFVTPLFTPMGIHEDNWPATVGLLTGVLAKEVVVGTLNALYSQLNHVADLQASGFSIIGGLHDALLSIPANLGALGGALGNPLLAGAPINALSQDVYGVMYQRFDGQISAMAYLLFVLLYFPCISTTAAMLRELHKGWAIFSIGWTTGLAYCVAVSFYQLATFLQHPFMSFCWVLGMILTLFIAIVTVRYLANYSREKVRYEFA